MAAESRRLSALAWSLAVAAVALVAWLPWWRNHGYLRDLYDYGLVIAANGHLNLGERPYVDFTTPIQAGFLGLNWMFERLGHGTYAGLTLGGAALIIGAAVTLPLMLARRWPGWAAAIVGGAVTVSAASQHTILWHNSLGVICLAIATWAAACAPVLRRADWPWHLLVAAGFFSAGSTSSTTSWLLGLSARPGRCGRGWCGRRAGPACWRPWPASHSWASRCRWPRNWRGRVRR
ncbi:MAG: hypothetical protein WDM96_02930 [Lacunisphaera sp.]